MRGDLLLFIEVFYRNICYYRVLKDFSKYLVFRKFGGQVYNILSHNNNFLNFLNLLHSYYIIITFYLQTTILYFRKYKL